MTKEEKELDVLVSHWMTLTHQYNVTMRKAHTILGNVRKEVFPGEERQY